MVNVIGVAAVLLRFDDRLTVFRADIDLPSAADIPDNVELEVTAAPNTGL